MTTSQAVERVKQDKGLASRYPMRLIFVENYQQYQELVNALLEICEKRISLAECCSGDDVYPNFDRVRDAMNADADNQILLLSVGEYLRIGFRREMNPERRQFATLWESQQCAQSKTRLIVPLYGCKNLWDRVMPRIDERQLDFIWNVDPPVDKPLDHTLLEVYSRKFEHVLPREDTMVGIKTWLAEWTDIVAAGQSCKLVTALCNNVENCLGVVETKVIMEPFAYLVSLISDTAGLKKEWGTEEQWAYLVSKCAGVHSLRDLMLSELNLRHFDPISVLGGWSILTEEQKWLFWLWYRIYPTNDYYSYAVCGAVSTEEIPHNIYFSLIPVLESHSEWEIERKTALEKMDYEVPAEELDQALRVLALYSERLRLLCCRSHAEKAYAVYLVSKWLRTGAEYAKVLESVHSCMPWLYEYLSTNSETYSDELSVYFENYRHCKIANIILEDHEVLSHNIHVDEYDARYQKLQPFDNAESYMLWVDALGIEWLPYLQLLAKDLRNGHLTHSYITQAILPTETCFNDIWNDMVAAHDKQNKLDILAHRGMPDDKSYYSCVVYQLEFMQTLICQIDTQLQQHPVVIVTGDHGTSRVAALSVHTTPGIAAPAGAIVKSHGRYCELTRPFDKMRDGIAVETKVVSLDGKEYSVMCTSAHYIQKGCATGTDIENATVGEVHGGATPEEALVPVLLFQSNCDILPAVTFTVTNSSIYRVAGGCTVNVIFDQPIHVLQAVLDGKTASCSSTDSVHWVARFADAPIGKKEIAFEADGKLLDARAEIWIKTQGIQQNDDPFGGM